MQGVIIECVAFNLKLDKGIRNVLDFLGKTTHDRRITALPFCKAVIDRSVGLSPCGGAAL